MEKCVKLPPSSHLRVTRLKRKNNTYFCIQSTHTFRNSNELEQLTHKGLVVNVGVSGFIHYWHHHCHLQTPWAVYEKSPPSDSLVKTTVNSCIPLLFVYNTKHSHYLNSKIYGFFFHMTDIGEHDCCIVFENNYRKL